MAFDYSKLRGRIREVFGTDSKFAKAMNMSNQTLSAKLNNKVPFTQNEIRKSCILLKIEDDQIPAYFFTV